MAELDVVASLLKVVVVFGLLAISLFVLRRVRGGGRSVLTTRRAKTERAIEVVEQQMIGRAPLAVVRFRGHEALLGISEDKITVISRPEAVAATDSTVIDLRDTPTPHQLAKADALLEQQPGGLVTRLREMTVRH